MKKLQLFVLLMTIQLLVIYDVQAQTYDMGDTTALGVIRDNNFVEDDPLNWSDTDPANWLGVIWDESEPKRVIRLELHGEGDGSGDPYNGESWPVSHDWETKYQGFVGTGVSSTLDGTLDFSVFSELQALDLRDQDLIDTVIVDELVNLEAFYIAKNSSMSFIDLSDLPNLQYVHLQRMPNFESIDLSNCPSLIKVKAGWGGDNSISDINLEGSDAIRKLCLKEHNLIKIDVSGKSELEKLALSLGGSLKEITGLEDLDNLFATGLSNNQIEGIVDVSAFNYEKLYKLSMSNNRIESVSGIENALELDEIVNLNVDGNTLTLTEAVSVSDFQGAVDNSLDASPQTRYGGFAEIVPVSLDYSDEALIMTSGGDVATTFTLFNDEDTQIDQNTTGLFEITDDEDADIYYVTMENSGVTLTTNNITVLPGGSSVLNASLSDDDFEAYIGQSDSQTLTVENTGDEALEITDITLPHEDFSIDATTATIAAGGSEDFTVTFAPTKDSVYVGDLEIVSDADAGDNIFELTGIGLEPEPAISASLDAAFGTIAVNASQEQTLTITNTGTGNLNVTNITVPNGFAIDATTAIIDVGANATFTVTFSPTEAITYSGDITITSDATDGDNIVAVSGTGVATSLAASLSAAFGEVAVGSSENQTLTVSNGSGLSIDITNITVPNGFAIDATSATVADGASATFTVTFSPTEAITYSGDITITSDATDGDNIVAVSGTGVATSLAASLSAAFGEVAVGSSENQTLTVSNGSGLSIDITDITVPNGFAIDATSATVADGASATFTVTFSPTEAIAYSGNIVIVSNASSGDVEVSVSGTGIEVLSTKISKSEISMYPNPTMDGIIYVNGILTESLSLSVYSITGKEVMSMTLSKEDNMIDLSEIKSGTYILSSPDMSFYQKVIKK